LLEKINPMIEGPLEAQINWKGRVPTVAGWQKDPPPGLLVAVVEARTKPDDESERIRIFNVADVGLYVSTTHITH
jgi:hypothetical protein